MTTLRVSGVSSMAEKITKTRRWTTLLVLVAMSAIAAVGCGSDGEDTDSGSSGSGSTGVLEDRVISRADATFTMDDLVAQGYKKSREFDTETLGGASEAWYGFFQQKDIEVWVYASHQEALDSGVPIAETTISKEAGQTDPLIPVVNRYPAFAVVGNLVMLCERELATCEALIEQLP